MPRALLDRAAWALVGALALLLIATLAGVARGGPLDPTTSPGPTLPQVEPRMPIRQPAAAADFPISLSQPGSYFLTQNITGVAGKAGISIDADNVSIDLDGFSLLGVGSSLDAITLPAARKNVSIHGGLISGWGGAGIAAANASALQIDSVQANNNAGGGIIGGESSLIANCIARGNGGNGILVAQPLIVGASTIRGCLVEASVLDGIVADNNTVIEGNHVNDNSVDGIHTTGSGNRIDGNNLVGNNASATTGKTIRVTGTNSVIIRNTIKGFASDLDIPTATNTRGAVENAGTPLSNPWANITY